MKQIGYFLLVFLFTECGFKPVSRKLVEVDSLLKAEQNDSAYRQLLSIDNTLKMSEAERAYYNLLITRTSYLVNRPLKSDSLLDMATTFFQSNEDKSKLADCYYYKAAGFYKHKNFQKAILYNKKAEKMGAAGISCVSLI